MTDHEFQADTLRLPPMPAPTLASDEAFCWAAPNSVKTADFSESALDFRRVAATCICVLPACAARRPLTMLIISIRNTPPSHANYPGLVKEFWVLRTMPQRAQIVIRGL